LTPSAPIDWSIGKEAVGRNRNIT